MDLATILICSLPKVAINVHLCHCLGGYVYIKYDKNITRVITESPNTGASKKLHITCRHAGHLFKFKHMSRGSFSCHILPTYIVVRRSVAYVVSPSQWVYSIEMDTLSRLQTVRGYDSCRFSLKCIDKFDMHMHSGYANVGKKNTSSRNAYVRHCGLEGVQGKAHHKVSPEVAEPPQATVTLTDWPLLHYYHQVRPRDSASGLDRLRLILHILISTQ